jgi:NADH-quinone oxidoreductase subunit M
VFFGKLDKAKNGKLQDLRGHELFVFIVLALGIFVGGVYPKPLLNIMEPSVQKFTRDFTSRVNEPDGPPHIYGKLPAPPAPAAPEGNAAPAGNTPPAGNPPPPTGNPPPPPGAAPAGGTP